MDWRVRKCHNGQATHAVVKLQLSVSTSRLDEQRAHLPSEHILAGDRSGDRGLALGVHRGRHDGFMGYNRKMP